MGKRIYPLNKIKYWYCYDINDICDLYQEVDLSDRTIFSWIKKGLVKIDNKRPFLIRGYDLKNFLGKMNKSNKCQTKFDQMFCMSCKDARNFYQNQITIEMKNNFLAVKTICRTCKSTMNKSYKLDNFGELKRKFNMVEKLQLSDCKTPPLKTDLQIQEKINLKQLNLIDLIDEKEK